MPENALADPAKDLIIVRRFLVQGIENVARADDISIRAGIILVDLAAEALLKCALRYYAKPIHPKSDFPKLLQDVMAAPPPGTHDLGFLTGLSALRSTRNCVMHDGTGQDPQVARDLVGRAERILVQTVREVWSRDLLNLRIADFIRDAEVNRFVTATSEHYEAGRHGMTAAYSTALFDELLTRWARFTGQLFFPGAHDAQSDHLVAAVSAGVHLPDLRQFRAATAGARVEIVMSGRMTPYYHGWERVRTSEQQANDARFALDFVGGLALQMDERIPLAEFLSPYEKAAQKLRPSEPTD